MTNSPLDEKLKKIVGMLIEAYFLAACPYILAKIICSTAGEISAEWLQRYIEDKHHK